MAERRAKVILQTIQNIGDYCEEYYDKMTYEELGYAIAAYRHLKGMLKELGYNLMACDGRYFLA